jgi:S1-C subfamily serine protease
VQTDVRLNVGCSGGGLFNLDGELVGLTTALAALAGGDTPGGFALPLDDNVKQIVEVLKLGKEVEYGFLGVSLYPGERRGGGVRLADVVEGSPAANPLEGRRLQAGEWIVNINGREVRENDDLFLLISIGLAGNRARLQVASSPQGQRHDVVVRLAKYATAGPAPIASRRPAPRAGLRVDHASVVAQGARGGFGRAYIPDGVAIREVVPNSPADRARLEPNRIIQRVNGREVHTPNEFYATMDAATGPVKLTLLTTGRQQLTEEVALDGK